MPFITALIVCLIFVSAANANLVEEFKSYLCCGSPEIKVDAPKDCEQTWLSAEKKIAEYHPDLPPPEWDCVPPCRSVSPGKLIMDGCLNVTLRRVCPVGKSWQDTMTYYTAQTDECLVTPKAIVKSADSPRNRYGLVPAPLLVFFVCLSAIWCLCKRKQWSRRL